MSTQPVRLVIVDDVEMVRFSLAFGFGVFPDLQVVGEAADVASAVNICRDLCPDIVLMDLVLPGNGLNAICEMRCFCPSVRTVLLSAFVDDDIQPLAKAAGVSAVFSKEVTMDTPRGCHP